MVQDAPEPSPGVAIPCVVRGAAGAKRPCGAEPYRRVSEGLRVRSKLEPALLHGTISRARWSSTPRGQALGIWSPDREKR